jgi:ribokinase
VIVVFGSINLDLVARVAKLPAPGQTLAGRSFACNPGGKGANQALAARRAGADVALFGAVGRDAFARPALALLREGCVALDGVREVDATTGVALIHVEDSGENAITVVAGANALASADQVSDDLLSSSTTVLLQFETPPAESLALAVRAKSRGARVVLNTAPFSALDPSWLASIDVLIANEHEAAALAGGLELPEDADAFAAATATRYGIATIVTLGSKGAIAATRAIRYSVPALPVQCIDTVGAGDAFVGVLAAALDRGADLPQALAHAASAGALACTREGAQPSLPHASDIERAAGTLEARVRITPVSA